MHEVLLARLLHYVQIHTTSDPHSRSVPSTARQWDLLLTLLRDDLTALGAADVTLTDAGYVLATLPATARGDLPAVAFLAHVDTAPDIRGENVKPIVQRNDAGTSIVLPDDPGQALDPVFDAQLARADGSRLTERGLPAPNLFDVSHNLHGPLEWASINNDMDQALENGIELVQLRACAGAGYPHRCAAKGS